MNQACFQFFEALDDLLPSGKRGASFTYSFGDHQSIKHLIEALGVPHTEVSRILANGRLVDFDYIVRDGDEIEVYPFGSMTGASLQGIPADPPRFVIDNHLGKLARMLRMLGFDCLYHNDYQDEELARLAVEENRTLLTRDRRLLMRKMISAGYCVRELDPHLQVQEVVRRFNLYAAILPFRRCINCNGLLQPVSKEAVLDRLEPLTKQYFEDFRICPDCGQVYWRGSHFKRMERLIEDLLEENT
jgi:uncharacterized protein with PIN domain